MEKESQLNYYKNHVKQLTEELQKLTSLFETVKNENFNLKKATRIIINSYYYIQPLKLNLQTLT